MRARRTLLLLALVGVFVGAGFGTGRLLFDRYRTEAQTPETPRLTPELERLLQEEKQKPRFTGELLGLYFAPTEDQWPEDYRRWRSELLAGGCVNVPAERGAELGFPRPLALPEQCVLGGTEVVACGETVTSVNWHYTFEAPNGLPANILISRSLVRAFAYDVAAERISRTTIGGRDAIVIRPVTPDGVAQTSAVIFPEAFGTTSIDAVYLPEADLLALAEAVARASK
jgi:hypothetical protein